MVQGFNPDWVGDVGLFSKTVGFCGGFPAGEIPAVPYIIYLSSTNLKKPYIPYPTPVKYLENKHLTWVGVEFFAFFSPTLSL